jgi:hypothetical protein
MLRSKLTTVRHPPSVCTLANRSRCEFLQNDHSSARECGAVGRMNPEHSSPPGGRGCLLLRSSEGTCDFVHRDHMKILIGHDSRGSKIVNFLVSGCPPFDNQRLRPTENCVTEMKKRNAKIQGLFVRPMYFVFLFEPMRAFCLFVPMRACSLFVLCR